MVFRFESWLRCCQRNPELPWLGGGARTSLDQLRSLLRFPSLPQIQPLITPKPLATSPVSRILKRKEVRLLSDRIVCFLFAQNSTPAPLINPPMSISVSSSPGLLYWVLLQSTQADLCVINSEVRFESWKLQDSEPPFAWLSQPGVQK